MALPFQEEKQVEKLAEIRRHEEEAAIKREARKLNLPYLDLLLIPVSLDALTILSEEKSRDSQLAIIQENESGLQIAVRDPNLPKTKGLLNELEKKYKTNLFLVSSKSLEKAFQSYKTIKVETAGISGRIEISLETIDKFKKELLNPSIIKERISALASHQASSFLELIIGGALSLSASDIHIEPEEKQVRLRYRLDGMLQNITFFDFKIFKLLLARIKLLSGLKINVADAPQDGRFTIGAGQEQIEIRTSVLPGPYGESIVLRILDPKAISVTLEQLGISEYDLEVIEKEIEKPNGMILVTGPTGSGKTTTLYAFLKKLNTPDVKIITIEDPIEYHIEGISQSQVEPDRNYTFASGLRSILRQDPDIILVGEIRDLETAEISLHAALTGHLVFSTLHTNDSAGTILRFLDVGAKPAIIAPAINLAIAQRLVRKLCSECKKKIKITTEQLNNIRKNLKNLSSKAKLPKLDEKLEIYQAAGCPKCNNTGYKGRIGIYELFLIDEDAEQLINSAPTESQLKALALKKGMITMKQDGFIKVLKGITDIEEVERITGE